MVKIIHWNNVRKQREIKLVATDERRNQLVSEPYNKMVFRRLISNRNEKKSKYKQASIFRFFNIRN